MRKRKDDRAGGEAPEPGNPILAERLKELGFAPTEPPTAPAGDAEASTPAADSDSGSVDLARAGKIVLAREKKGRGGKTVTVIRIANLSAGELERLARSLRKGLGCGAAVETGTIVLQGDLSQRARAWLQEHGARSIVQGN